MRKSIPSEADNTFVVTRGLDKCIFAYPINEWDEKYKKSFESLNQFDPMNRQFLRRMLECSEDVVLDGQQRMTLPKELLEFAGIDGKVTLIGMLDHIEFWNPDTYEEYINNCEDSYESIAEKVMRVNI
ncbi:Transcriptional regulator MraZ [bioreactor metagenome]|uniref:Transcriptional regulator MraZ n=1 Tax=bioreactor metagenome TaxID=1076179 RepID=A0A645IVL3_9ZZZZ